jgi:glycosyltransferase involved in cell wall biosynthesis
MVSGVPDTPAVSVLLSSFNQAQYLREAIESVFAQTSGDWELLLVDNGSTDGSQEIMREYEGDPRVRLLLFEENGPITKRFNSGVRAARGEFVSFLFSDDFYLPQKLERQVAAFRSLPDDYGVVYGPPLRLNDLTGARWQSPSIDASGDVFRSLMLDHYDGPVEMIPAMIRREALLRHPFHEDLFTEGENVFFRIALTHRFAFLDEPLSVMRDHETNMGKALVPNVANIRRALAKLRRDDAMTPERLGLVDEFEGNLLRSSGWQAARLNVDPAWARACFVSAIRISPRHAVHPKTLAGLAITLLPDRPRDALNRAGHRLRNAPGNASLRHDYERPAA